MPLKQVKSFQTTDGKLYPNKVMALNEEFKLELRGAVQARTKSNTLTTTEIAAILAVDSENISKVIRKYTIAINRAKGEASKVQVV